MYLLYFQPRMLSLDRDIIISGFGIYGAAVVPDSGVGNTRQHLTLVLHEFPSNGLTPSRLHIVISFLTHADHVFLGLPRSLVPGMTLSHTQCASLHAVNDAKRLITRLWVTGWAVGTLENTATTAFQVSCHGLPVFCTISYDVLSVFSRQCWVVLVSTVWCAHISDPVSVQYNHGLDNLWPQRWQAASVHLSDADWSEYGTWLSYLLSAIYLSCRQPWNLKPVHGRCCGHFREA